MCSERHCVHTYVRPSLEVLMWSDGTTLNPHLRGCYHKVSVQALGWDAALAEFAVVQLH